MRLQDGFQIVSSYLLNLWAASVAGIFSLNMPSMGAGGFTRATLIFAGPLMVVFDSQAYDDWTGYFEQTAWLRGACSTLASFYAPALACPWFYSSPRDPQELTSIVKTIMWGHNNAAHKFLQFQTPTNITVVIVVPVFAVAPNEKPTPTVIQLFWINATTGMFAAPAPISLDQVSAGQASGGSAPPTKVSVWMLPSLVLV